MNKQKIEDFGLFLEKYGYAPVAARVYALMILEKPHEFHFDTIKELLNISKGATSGALKYLEGTKKVNKKTKPGERKRFYCLGNLPGIESLGPMATYLSAFSDHISSTLKSEPLDSDYLEKMKESLTFCTNFIKLIEENHD